MKNLLTSLLLCVISFTAFAQETKPSAINKHKVKSPKLDRVLIEAGVCNFPSLPTGMTLDVSKSRMLALESFNDKPFGSSPFSFAWGIGFTSRNFNSNCQLVDDSLGTFTSWVPIQNGVKLDVNKLSVNYIDIPLELRYRSKVISNGKRIKFSAGFKPGYMIQNHFKVMGSGIKYKYYNWANINKWHYGITGRLGYGRLGLSMYYGMNTLFKDGRGPAMTPYSISLSISVY